MRRQTMKKRTDILNRNEQKTLKDWIASLQENNQDPASFYYLVEVRNVSAEEGDGDMLFRDKETWDEIGDIRDLERYLKKNHQDILEEHEEDLDEEIDWDFIEQEDIETLCEKAEIHIGYTQEVHDKKEILFTKESALQRLKEKYGEDTTNAYVTPTQFYGKHEAKTLMDIFYKLAVQL